MSEDLTNMIIDSIHNTFADNEEFVLKRLTRNVSEDDSNVMQTNKMLVNSMTATAELTALVTFGILETLGLLNNEEMILKSIQEKISNFPKLD